MLSANQALQSAVRRHEHELRAQLRTNSWQLAQFLLTPLSKVRINIGPRPVPEPAEAALIRAKHYHEVLEKSLLKLSSESKNAFRYVIAQDNQAPLRQALYQIAPDGARRKIIWDGISLSLSRGRFEEDSGQRYEAIAHLVNYSEILACADPNYGAAFRTAKRSTPHAELGISCIVETTDGLSALVRRGDSVPIYPGRYSLPSGNVTPLKSLVDDISSELEEELGLQSGTDFEASSLVAIGLVYDLGRHNRMHKAQEIVTRVALKIDSKTLRERFAALNKAADAERLVVSSLDQLVELGSTQSNSPHPELPLCPGTCAGLVTLQRLRKLKVELSNSSLTTSALDGIRRSSASSPAPR